MYYPRLKDLREDHDLMQKEIASILGIDQRVYSNYETGKREIEKQGQSKIKTETKRYKRITTRLVKWLIPLIPFTSQTFSLSIF